MIFLLILLLCLELAFIYFTNGKKIVSPSFLSCAMFVFSSVVYALYMNDMYGSDITLKTAVIIVSLIFCLYLGEQFVNKTAFARSGESLEKTKGEIFQKPYTVSNFYIFVLTLVVTGACLVYYFDIYRFSLLLGNTDGIWKMAEYVRHAKNYGTGTLIYSPSTIVSQLTIIAEVLVYYCVYIFTVNLWIHRERCLKFLIPCLGYIFYIVACDSRSYLIRNVTIIAIIMFSVLNNSEFKAKTINKKIIKTGLISIVAFFLMFRILGHRTGTSDNYTFVDNIVKYVSSSIFGFNKFIEDGRGTSELFGKGVFRLIYAKLNDFGMSFDIGSPHQQFFFYKRGESNIYTGLQTPVDDFTVFGAGIFLMIWAACVNLALIIIKNKGSSLLRCAGAGMLFFPITMISIGGEWGNTLSITTVYTLFYLFILTKITERKERKKC